MTMLVTLALAAALAECALGLVLVRSARRAMSCADADDRLARAGLVAGRLAVVAAVSAPLLWLALRDEVARWPGLVCVQGLLRLGSQAQGLAAGLPWFLGTTIAAKVLLALATGTWLTIRTLDRGTTNAPLARRVATWMAIAGALALVDGAAFLGWVLVPADGQALVAGCCTTANPGGGAIDVPTSEAGRSAWSLTFFASGAGTAACLASGALLPRLRAARSAWWPAALALAGVTVVAGGGFLHHTLAPLRTGSPEHECAFCVLERAPELWVGVLGVTGALACTVWAWCSARATVAGDAGDRLARRLLVAGAYAACAAITLGAVERAVA
jgi:hypothetical protein